MVTASALRTPPPSQDSLPVPPLPAATVLPLHKLKVDPAKNPRSEVDAEMLASIESSMRERLAQGLYPQETPVWAVPAGPDAWDLRAGWTRHAAIAAVLKAPPKDLPASSAAWVKAPTIWISPHNVDELGAALLSLRENVQRSQLPMTDIVIACAKIRKGHPKTTIAQLARSIGISDRLLANLLRVHETLTREQWLAYERRAITQEQAIRLAAIHDDGPRQRAFEELLAPPDVPKPSARASGDGKGDDGEGDEMIRLTRDASMGIAKRVKELVSVVRLSPHAVSPEGRMVFRALRLALDFVMSPNAQLHATVKEQLVEMLRRPTPDGVRKAELGARPATAKKSGASRAASTERKRPQGRATKAAKATAKKAR